MAQHVAPPVVIRVVIGSNLGLASRHTEDIKDGLLLCQVRDLNRSMGGMPWSINWRNSLPCTVRTSQTKVV